MQATALNIVDASIDELAKALSAGVVTSVDLVTAYLNRISTYDCRGSALNSIPILNHAVFEEAAASDERRARGQAHGLLDGIPFTVKDSYKVKGQTLASGSPAFQDLIASEDAFTVQKLRQAGAVLVGRTNMCPMAAGGMARGVYGRAESPYNSDFLAAAWASGSSNGSGVSTGASLAAFGMGEETVSSGRSPASNNALVAYTPSRGAISIRGNWPLYPTCDVVVPHARTMDDLLAILDVITIKDKISRGDFWRDQDFVRLPDTWANKPDSFRALANSDSLQRMRIAVPSMYIGGEQDPDSVPVYTCPEVIALYQEARYRLEALGATVVEIQEFPVVKYYEQASAGSEDLATQFRLPEEWHATERSTIIAYAWEQFLYDNNDLNVSSLNDVDHAEIYPSPPPDDPQLRFSEPKNRIHFNRLQELVNSASKSFRCRKFDPRSALMSTPDLQIALEALESIRQVFWEDWLSTNQFDLVMFPACGDVGKSDADIDHESAKHAWTNGVHYSNGNRALRHLGMPTVTVPMGNMKDKEMPVGLTFLGRAGDDLQLLRWAYAYEQASKKRTPPKLTPALGPGRDVFPTTNHYNNNNEQNRGSRTPRPDLKIEKCETTPTSRNGLRINIEGFITCRTKSFSSPPTTTTSKTETPTLTILIDNHIIPPEKVSIQQCQGTMCGRTVYDFRCSVVVPEAPAQNARNRVAARQRIARDSCMVVVLAGEGEVGLKSGFLKLL